MKNTRKGYYKNDHLFSIHSKNVFHLKLYVYTYEINNLYVQCAFSIQNKIKLT